MEYSKILEAYKTIKEIKLDDYVELIGQWDEEKVKVYGFEYNILNFVHENPGIIKGGDNQEAIIAYPYAPALKKKVQMFSAYGIGYFNDAPIALFHKTDIINPFDRITYEESLKENFNKEIEEIKKYIREMKGSINEFYHKQNHSIFYNSVRIHKDFYMEMLQGNDVKNYNIRLPETELFSDLHSQQSIEEIKKWKKIFEKPLSHGEELANFLNANKERY